jgi:hypothetical protein
MVFPQGFDGQKLALNLVLIPRNQDPFNENTGLAGPDDKATAFADLKPQFEIGVARGLDEFHLTSSQPLANHPEKIAVNVAESVNKKVLLQAIAADFGAKINLDNTTDKAETAEITLNKYLPETYRDSFNFTSPRIKNAKTDDSYHCTIKKDKKKIPGWKNNDDLSWGQVFAHILRQPMLARACGMIYSVEISVADHPDWFKKGCYLFVDLVNADYGPIQQRLFEDNDGPFVKRYAARIPKLELNKQRPVFAPLLIPVLYRKITDAVDPEPTEAPWDQIFAEINEYNDGFAKIVHSSQPVSSNLLSEHQDGAHPVNDAGMRLAWDDEQILIWYVRQLTNNSAGERIDVPLGVFGYKIDVRKEGDAGWSSLNLVKSKKQYDIGGASLGNNSGDTLELPFQVFPTQPDNDTTAPYWLPMYYTSWIGKSLVLKDTDAVKIYRNNEALDPIGNPKSVSVENQFEEVAANAKLLYGNTYEFRVRLMDISGGGPAKDENLFNNAACPTAKRLFKRYIAPGLCDIEKPQTLKEAKVLIFNETIVGNKSVFDANPVLNIRRPVLTYPAVVFTNKYQAKGMDPIAMLIQSAAGADSITPALRDPDVTKVEIRVEVETLRLDNLQSMNGKENFITLYRTTRAFPDDFDAQLSVPITFRDVNVINLGNEADPFNDPALTNVAIDAMNEIPLPTARNIRITVRSVCDDQPNYFGFLNDSNPDLDSRYGITTQFLFYKESEVEDDLLIPKQNVAPLKGIYLQPDPVHIIEQKNDKVYLQLQPQENLPDIVQRLAQQLGVVSKGLTLVSKKGERVVFGCNNKIQHHLAPDQSSITFGTKGDLNNHWIGCIVYRLNRDWAWDALQDVSFTITRNKKFKRHPETENVVVGDIEMKHYASFESLIPDDFGIVNRDYTTLIFIDAIEPKSSLKKEDGELRFPDELEVDYTISPNFKPDHGSETGLNTEKLLLPTTVIPSQVPKIVSVGLAFSSFIKNEKYSATEPRQRFLWIELDEQVKDPNDTLFCRLLRYAPDQLIADNRTFPDETLTDPPLPIDPEYVRSITPNQSDDMAGLSAMQAMEKANDNDDIHYLLPLPPGLHSESPELFGFFTYEFRIGHGHWSNLPQGEKNLWSTANGRFGRPLRVTGMQHPAPTLLCSVDRDKDNIYVNAPYAKAVFNGKNITADPPRTQLHCVLYAQVEQADGLAYRNILLKENLMELRNPPEDEPGRNPLTVLHASQDVIHGTRGYDNEQLEAGTILSKISLSDQIKELKLDRTTRARVTEIMRQRSLGIMAQPDLATSRVLIAAFSKWKNNLDSIQAVEPSANFTNASLLNGAKIAIYKDKINTASSVWSDKEVKALLGNYGLPEDSPLSVIVVEVFGNISSIFEFLAFNEKEMSRFGKYAAKIKERKTRNEQALSDQLGNYRILRTSPLTEIPFVCCTTCYG